MRFRFFLLALLLYVPLSLLHAQRIAKTPAPEWITKNQIDYKINEGNNPTGSFYYLLIERQFNLITRERFNRTVFKILSSEGVQEMSDLSIEFDPEFQKLSFHSIAVYRNNVRIDKLAAAEIKTVQREESMDRYLYDGTKTAIINLTDIRVGDIVEYTYSLKGHNPVYEGHFSQYLYFDFSFPYQKLYQRVVLPKEHKYYFHYRNGEVKCVLLDKKQTKEYIWELNNASALITDNNTSGWYDPFRYMAITDFKDWEEVNQWSSKQFIVSPSQVQAVKDELPPDLFKGTIEERMLKSIRFVQDEIRYLGFENGIHSHKPHPPAQVLTQRFGDCKDKSLLLVVISRLQGVEAFPLLVNTSMRDKLHEDPATSSAFDHCVVQLTYHDKNILVDPTISNQGGSLFNIYFPTYGKGLLIKEGTKDLISFTEPNQPETKEEQFFDLGPIGSTAKMTVQTTYTGRDADDQRSEFLGSDLEITQKNYLTYYGNLYPDIAVEKPLQLTDNREDNVFIVEEYYVIQNFWKPDAQIADKIYCEFYPQAIDRFINIDKSTQRKAPYKLTYPLSYKHITRIKLPEPWSISNESKNISSDYYAYDYSVSYENNEITIVNNYQTKAPEVPVDFVNKFVSDHQKMMSELTYLLTYDKSLVTESQSLGSYHFIVLILSVAVGIYLLLRLNKFNPASKTDSTYGQPIGGWLILVAIGLCVTPIILVYTLLNAENNFFNHEVWSSLLSTNQIGLFSLMTLELSYNIVFLFFTGLLIILFFQRRTSLPILILFFYGISLCITILDSVAATYYTEIPFSEHLKDIFKSIVGAAIWIPYFLYSDRVKQTFTRRL